ncbi:phage tail protein [Ideonella sp. 4Y16]|uniref:Phage tail protein n=1 Tax=Ideonella alba TaxID=2824118 RepID=A0A941BAQ9_9BURK|nr:phage tail protein [Ideonella alba]MBQ0930060.1 phage tail protein [Ideonella alba]MBQ0946120.1 phage tail protein [Ideonella alba]
MYTPPVGFHFRVEVPALQGPADEVRFTEVGGLAVELSTEEVPEGGENRFVQKYPGRSKYPELTLKRGLLLRSAIWNWARRAIEDLDVEPMDVQVQLLGPEHQALMTWHLVQAYPTRWSVADLNASSNTVAVESMQLYYQRFRLEA